MITSEKQKIVSVLSIEYLNALEAFEIDKKESSILSASVLKLNDLEKLLEVDSNEN